MTSTQEINYQDVSEKHGSRFQGVTEYLALQGVDIEFNMKVAATTWIEIRRARGMILQSVGQEKAQDGETIEKKLTTEEIDRVTNLVTLVSMNAGILFWRKKLNEHDPVVRMQTKALEKLKASTSDVKNPDQYSRFGGAQVMDTIHQWVGKYLEHGAPNSDNLGEHFFALGKPHIFLDGISIDDLRKKLAKHPDSIIVLSASASSGVLEAGIIAEYMNKVLKLPTTVDPVFFNSGYTAGKGFHNETEVNVMNRTKPAQEHIVIPIDDRVTRSGYSASQAREGAEAKYGEKKVIMSEKMREMSDFLRKEKKKKYDEAHPGFFKRARGLFQGKQK